MSSPALWYQRLPLTKSINPKILTEKVRRRARIGRAHWDSSFQEIPDGVPYKKKVLGYCKTLEEWEPTGWGWIFYGKLGTGKTALASLVLKWCLVKGGRVLAFRHDDLVDRLMSFKQQYAPNQAPLEMALHNVNYLLIDDLRIDPDNRPRKMERLRKLESVLRRRYDEQLPTIITTNEKKEDLFNIDWLKNIIYDSYLDAEIVGINWRSNPPNTTASDSIL